MSDVSSALQPPPGQSVDYFHSESIGHRVVEASLSTIALATTVVVLRLIVKLRITKSSGWDDCKTPLTGTLFNANEIEIPWC